MCNSIVSSSIPGEPTHLSVDQQIFVDEATNTSELQSCLQMLLFSLQKNDHSFQSMQISVSAAEPAKV